MSFDFSNIDWRTQFFPKRAGLSMDLTTIDVMKAFAVGLMIIDHTGWLLFPEIEWFRVFGRLCVPLWFFLIGYSNSRDIPPRWMAAGVVLLLSSLLVGLPALPLSVLFTMAFIRLGIDLFWRFILPRGVYFWWVYLLLVFFWFVTDKVIEYGTLGFLLANIGYVVRHRERVVEYLGEAMPQTLIAVTLATFGVLQCMQFGFSMLGAMVVAAGLLGMFFILPSFEAKTLPGTANHGQASLVRFMGRYTLEIYVLHLLVLKGAFGLQKLAAWVIG